MANLNYRRGADKERRIVNEARKNGCIAFRSAGSHSPIDVCLVDHKNRVIKLIQCKSSKKLKGGIKPSEKARLEKEYEFLEDAYYVKFEAL